MQLPTLLRYGLLAGVVGVANANRRYYRMTTTWLPHLVANALALLLPEIIDLFAPGRSAQRRTAAPVNPITRELQAIQALLADMIHGNPRYVTYIAPLAGGYLCSHPQFNIYKGDLAELRLAGFGLDALPHSATAFGLTALAWDAVQAAQAHPEYTARLTTLLRRAAGHEAIFSAAVLAGATLLWEIGEYRIYQHEMAQRGDRAQINMQWSLEDTLFDCLSNIAGWGLALAWRSALQASR